MFTEVGDVFGRRRATLDVGTLVVADDRAVSERIIALANVAEKPRA